MKQFMLTLHALLTFAIITRANAPDSIPVIPQVDNAVREFMKKYNVPGMSVAITKNGRTVYIKGYGYADTAERTKVSPESLFRIASVSKPVTALAIMKLKAQGKLSLDDFVFGDDGILGTTYGTLPYNDTVSNITVRHLLQHTCGGWQNDGSDPMFSNKDLPGGELISWTLDNRPLQHAPGEAYAYSNFGYCILGRVIEKLSGQPYDVFVKENILKPAGVNNMVIGGNTEAERQEGEVKYYGQHDEDPYIYNISRMDAHGGWLASVADLSSLILKYDGEPDAPDLLDKLLIDEMVTPSEANPNYSCGWAVNSAGNWWHNGSLPGTATELVRTSQGFNWVVLANTRSWHQEFMRDLDVLIWKAVNDKSTAWPGDSLTPDASVSTPAP